MLCGGEKFVEVEETVRSFVGVLCAMCVELKRFGEGFDQRAVSPHEKKIPIDH